MKSVYFNFILFYINIINGIKIPAEVSQSKTQETTCGKTTFRYKKYELLSGKHSLEISYDCCGTGRTADVYYGTLYYYRSKSPVNISFEAKAGHKYTLTNKENYEKREWGIVIINSTTNEVISTFGPYALEFISIGPIENIRKRKFDSMMKQHGL